MAERKSKVFQYIGFVSIHFMFGCVWIWTLLALWYLPLLPQWARIALAGIWLIGVPLGTGSRGRLTKAVVLSVGLGSVSMVWMFQEARYSEAAVPNLAQTPYSHISGNDVVVYNLRNSHYSQEGKAATRWETRTYQLDKLQTLDFFIIPFGYGNPMAHTMLSFGFEDGEYLSISVEIERLPDRRFDPLSGMFRQFILRYVAGTERDLISLRCHVAKDPVRLYPLKAKPKEIRGIFVSMLERATRLHNKPEYYNTLTNNCTTNIVKYFELLSGSDLGVDWRIYMAYYIDEILLKLGLIDGIGTIENTRILSSIHTRCPPDTVEEKAWSRAIREDTEL